MALDSKRTIVPVLFDGLDLGQTDDVLETLIRCRPLSVSFNDLDVGISHLRDRILETAFKGKIEVLAAPLDKASQQARDRAEQAPKVNSNDLEAEWRYEESISTQHYFASRIRSATESKVVYQVSGLSEDWALELCADPTFQVLWERVNDYVVVHVFVHPAELPALVTLLIRKHWKEQFGEELVQEIQPGHVTRYHYVRWTNEATQGREESIERQILDEAVQSAWQSNKDLPRVFLCASRKNRLWALAIRENLTQYGYDVAVDLDQATDPDAEKLVRADISARRHFIALMTPSALQECVDPTSPLVSTITMASGSRRNMLLLTFEGCEIRRYTGNGALAEDFVALLANYMPSLVVGMERFDESMNRLRRTLQSMPQDPLEAPPVQRNSVGDDESMVRSQLLAAEEAFERALWISDAEKKAGFFSEAIRLDPAHAGAYLGRANANRVLGKLESALQDYSNAIRLDPQRVDVPDKFKRDRFFTNLIHSVFPES